MLTSFILSMKGDVMISLEELNVLNSDTIKELEKKIIEAKLKGVSSVYYSSDLNQGHRKYLTGLGYKVQTHGVHAGNCHIEISGWDV